MAPRSGTYTIGPETATLIAHTGRTGPAAKAGHELDIRVERWSAQLVLGERPEDSSLKLEADGASLTVLTGTGGPKPLSDEDRGRIKTTIDTKLLQRVAIAFASEAVHGSDPGDLHIHGQLSLGRAQQPLAFTLTVGDDGELSGSATVAQSDFGIPPYSAMMGALKLADEVEVRVEGRLPAA